MNYKRLKSFSNNVVEPLLKSFDLPTECVSIYLPVDWAGDETGDIQMRISKRYFKFNMENLIIEFFQSLDRTWILGGFDSDSYNIDTTFSSSDGDILNDFTRS